MFLPETLLITLQRWRGVPSHFNYATPFDIAVFSLMGILIAFVSLAIIVLTVWSFVALRRPWSTAVAIQMGLVFLTLGQLLGFAIGANGNSLGHDASNASILGAAGEMRLPHAIAIHGLQATGILALALERTRLSEARRLGLVALATVGYAVALAVSVVHTYQGRAPLDLTPLTVTGAGAALVLLGLAYVGGARALRRRVPVGGRPAN